MKSWQNAKFLESSAPDPFSATTSIPISFDYTVSKRYYVQLQLLLAFHIIKIKRRKMCQFSGIFKDILGQKWENPGGVPYGGHFEFLTKSKVYLRYWCKDLPAHQKLLKSAQPCLWTILHGFLWDKLVSNCFMNIKIKSIIINVETNFRHANHSAAFVSGRPLRFHIQKFHQIPVTCWSLPPSDLVNTS